MTQHASQRGEPLDAIDRRIVAELSRDGRLSVRTLAERVHISRTAAHNRVLALQQRGVITGFGAQIDRKAISWEEIAAKLATLPFVEKVQAVSGDIDIILTVSAPDHEQLSQAILRDIHDMPGVVSTRSHLILAELDGRPPAQSLDIWRP
jgi:DNA-binding Lrp family transcriptional regulator